MKKRFLLTSILMLLLTVLALSTSTYAWFSMSTTNSVSEFTITAASATGGLEISKNGTTWTSGTVAFTNPSLKAYDCTSSDGIHFTKGGKNTDSTTKAENPVTATAGKDFYEFTLYFRTTSNGEIQLNKANSYIVPDAYKDMVKSGTSTVDAKTFVTNAVAKESDSTNANKINWSNETQATQYNKSSNGDFSRDWIAAAARVSFTVTGFQSSNNQNYQTSSAQVIADNAYTVKAFDALRYAQLGQDELTGTWTIAKNTSVSLPNAEQVKEYTDLYYEVTELTADNLDAMKAAYPTETEGKVAGDTFNKPVHKGNGNYYLGNSITYSVEELMNSGSTTIATLSEAETGVSNLKTTKGDIFIVEVTARIWIEGQDNEADLPLTAGLFTSAFEFTFAEGAAFSDKGVVAISGLTYANGGFSWALTEGLTTATLYKGTVNNLTTALPDSSNKISDFDNKTYVYKYAGYDATSGYCMIAEYDPDDYTASNSFKVNTGTESSPVYKYYTYINYEQQAVKLKGLTWTAGVDPETNGKFTWSAATGLTVGGVYAGTVTNATTELPAALTGSFVDGAFVVANNSVNTTTTDYVVIAEYDATLYPYLTNTFTAGGKTYTYFVLAKTGE